MGRGEDDTTAGRCCLLRLAAPSPPAAGRRSTAGGAQTLPSPGPAARRARARRWLQRAWREGRGGGCSTLNESRNLAFVCVNNVIPTRHSPRAPERHVNAASAKKSASRSTRFTTMRPPRSGFVSRKADT